MNEHIPTNTKSETPVLSQQQKDAAYEARIAALEADNKDTKDELLVIKDSIKTLFNSRQ
jgi:hypothetical protein